jgi:hypothetical protein
VKLQDLYPVEKNRQPALPDAELYALYVKPSCQRRRMARQLTRTLVNALMEQGFRSLVIGVLQANETGRRFYESIGGQPAGGQTLLIGGDAHSEVFYGWPAIQAVAV